MLAYFKVENFKNFNALEFDFEKARNYEFNENAVKDGIVKTSVVYGTNGSGKTNLGLALLDISTTLIDKPPINISKYSYIPYLNLNDNMNAKFHYKFKFNLDYVEYFYEKSCPFNLISEKLLINNNEVVSYNHLKFKGETKLIGTENLVIPSKDFNIPFIKYINSNSALNYEDKNNSLFKKFIDFVDTMLLITGFHKSFTNQGEGGNIDNIIIRANKLNKFQDFLKAVGINYNLIIKEINGEKKIFCKFGDKEADFWSVASAGTKQLAVQFILKEWIEIFSFYYLDEFDAFYHFKLSRDIVKTISEKQAQVVFTTHNTSLLNNDILRPDCYFILKDDKIKSLDSLTDKELREAHNIEKMFRGDFFDE